MFARTVRFACCLLSAGVLIAAHAIEAPSMLSLQDVDCNSNGVADEIDIATGTSQDCDSDGTADDCEVGCPGGDNMGVSSLGLPRTGIVCP